MNTTTAPSDTTLAPGARVKFANHVGAVDKLRGTVIRRGEAIRADLAAARRAHRTELPVRWDDDGTIGWYMPCELDVVVPAPAVREPGADDMKVTVDHLAGMGSGRPVVTIRFTAPRELFDVPVEQWRDVALAEAQRRRDLDR